MYSPYATAASFALDSSYYVSMIGVDLRTPAATSFTTFHFSLQSALTDPVTVFATEDLTASLGVASVQVMNVDETLPAGTYYLAGIVPDYAGTSVTPGDVDGWMLSTGVYSGTAGTIANGVWAGNPPTFLNAPGYAAPAFSDWTLGSRTLTVDTAGRRNRLASGSPPPETSRSAQVIVFFCKSLTEDHEVDEAAGFHLCDVERHFVGAEVTRLKSHW